MVQLQQVELDHKICSCQPSKSLEEVILEEKHRGIRTSRERVEGCGGSEERNGWREGG